MAVQQTATRNQYRDFSVAVIGTENNDQITLGRIFGVTRYRSRRYALIPIALDMSLERSLSVMCTSDIVIVNVNNPKAILLWSKLSARLPESQRKPVVRLTRDRGITSHPELTIAWPINPAKVLHTLDNYTIKHLDFIPELTIGADTELNRQTLQHIEAIGARKTNSNASRRIRALVADDSLAVRRQLQIEFDMLGSELDLVEDGDAALAATQRESYDIIFLDVVMPGMDGYSACKQIRKTTHNRTTPIVMLTSKSSKFDKLKGVLAGCDTYLTKPINHNEFTEVTSQHLKKKEQ